MEKNIRDHFQFLDYAPIVFLSALTKKRIHTLSADDQRSQRKPLHARQSSVLNEVVMDAVAMNPTPTDNGKRLRIY